MKGQKLCPSCGTPSGPRKFVCSNCGFVFPIKRKEKVVITPSDVVNLDEVLATNEVN